MRLECIATSNVGISIMDTSESLCGGTFIKIDNLSLNSY